jgi:predicted DNA-binding ribbon-helix-helix protein
MSGRAFEAARRGHMAKTSAATLRQLYDRVDEHAREMASLRSALAVQLKRIAAMQAELDVLPQARRRRETLRCLLAPLSPHANGRS